MWPRLVALGHGFLDIVVGSQLTSIYRRGCPCSALHPVGISIFRAEPAGFVLKTGQPGSRVSSLHVGPHLSPFARSRQFPYASRSPCRGSRRPPYGLVGQVDGMDEDPAVFSDLIYYSAGSRVLMSRIKPNPVPWHDEFATWDFQSF